MSDLLESRRHLRLPRQHRLARDTSASGIVLACGLALSACAGVPLAQYEAELAELNATIEELDELVHLHETDSTELQARLDEALDLLEAAPDPADVEETISRLEDALEESENELVTSRLLLDEQDGELEALRSRVATLETSTPNRAAAPAQSRAAEQSAPAPTQRAAPARASGCASGQVDINAAGSADLQRIHQIGPARAEQFPGLRPFSSVDDLIRVSGIGPAHLSAIKEQGVACVN